MKLLADPRELAAKPQESAALEVDIHLFHGNITRRNRYRNRLARRRERDPHAAGDAAVKIQAQITGVENAGGIARGIVGALLPAPADLAAGVVQVTTQLDLARRTGAAQRRGQRFAVGGTRVVGIAGKLFATMPRAMPPAFSTPAISA